MTTERNPIVWVTQEMPKLNYTSAEKYGDVRFITDSDFSSSSASITNGSIKAAINTFSDRFDEVVDYVVPSGSVLVSMLSCAALAKKGVKKVAFLRWDNRKMDYDCVNLGI
jgi:hypothetical protein